MPGGATPSPPAASEPTARTTSTAPTQPATDPAPAPPEPVRLIPSVPDEATGVGVDTVLDIRAAAGTLTGVRVRYTLKDRRGGTERGTLKGEVDPARGRWTAADRLEPAAPYAVKTTGRNASDGQETTTSTSFRTQQLSLAQQTYPSLQPAKGSRVGVGMPVVLTFDVAVKDRAEVERHLKVASAPAQSGTWAWFSDKEVHFWPKEYWRPGTEVTVAADLNGVDAGGGVYGQESARTSFTVGRSLATKIDLSAAVARDYRNGERVRTIPVSGGEAGWRTRSGVKLVMAKETGKVMTNEAIGAQEDYRLTAAHALRVTWSGEFLHSAPWNSAHLGRRNASHGCVGMSNSDAAWLYRNTLIGDLVVTTGTGRGLERGNGWTDWDVSYASYAKGSAL